MPFANFHPHSISVKSDALQHDITIHTLIGGSGPPLLLLHGYPQTGRIWHKIADKLAERFTVVVTDLRGKTSLGHPSFSILAHDRGARVAHRLAIDHPNSVEKLMVLDICPTLTMYEETDDAFARGYWHWFALLKPGIEDVISAAPDAWWTVHTGGRGPLDFWSEEDVAEYKTVFSNKESAHASCEDYRAAATIDLEHDRASLASDQRLSLQGLHVLWGKSGIIAQKWPNVLDVWRGYCQVGVEVSGKAMDSGHYIPEEADEAVLREALRFFGA